MNISLEKESLLKTIQNVNEAILSSNTLPVLNGIFLEAKNNSLSAYSTDLEIAIKDRVEANIKEEGKVVVLGRLLLDIAKNLKEGKTTIFLSEDKNNLFINSSNAEFKLNTISFEEYPQFPQIKKDKKVSMKGKFVIEAIRQIFPSIAREETRPVLMSVLFELKKGEIRITSTDSYRLSVKKIRIKEEESKQKTSLFIVPRRAAEKMLRVINSREMINMYFSEKQLVVEGETLVFVSRLMGGEYPDIKRLLQKERKTKILVKKEEILRAAKRVSLVSLKTPVELKVRGGKAIIENKGLEAGSAHEDLNIEGSNNEVNICFNSKYLIDGLEVIPEEQIVLEINNSSSPVIMRGRKNKDYTYLIMPVRLKNT